MQSTTRMGDGFRVEMTEVEIRKDIADATTDAAQRADIEPMTEDEVANNKHPKQRGLQ